MKVNTSTHKQHHNRDMLTLQPLDSFVRVKSLNDIILTWLGTTTLDS